MVDISTAPRRVLICPDSFKGSLAAAEVAEALAQGWRRVRPEDELTLIPLADGGEGTLEALAAADPSARRQSVGQVLGPDGRTVDAQWLLLGTGDAVIELAQSSGLPLLQELDPLGAHTYGLGQVLDAVLSTAWVSGVRRVLIGLGGSASTDGGTGALRALGARFLDAQGDTLELGGGALSTLAAVDLSALVRTNVELLVLCDVTAPLLGPRGAAAQFAPQKGADAAQVELLEAALLHLAKVLQAVGGSEAVEPGGTAGDAAELSGAGAAGGTGFGLVAGLGARLVPGFAVISEIARLDAALAKADLVITGEGRLDATSREGKVVGSVVARARGLGLKALVVAGSADEPSQEEFGPDLVTLVEVAGSAEVSLADPVGALRTAAARLARSLG